MSAPDVAGRLDAIRATIAVAAARSGRDPGEVTIVAAAKTVAPDRVRAAIAAGITAIGHNYVQELRAARDAVTEPVGWHYLGALRSGTAHLVADHADVVQTVAGERATRRLAGRAARAGRELEVLIEVDFTGERPGVAPEEVRRFADLVAGVSGVRPRGLMTVAPLGGDAEDARPWFRALRALRDVVREDHPDMLDLSMGMSLDYAIAVEEGATMVRIGSQLFGPRSP
jgi:hypothetical protein